MTAIQPALSLLAVLPLRTCPVPECPQEDYDKNLGLHELLRCVLEGAGVADKCSACGHELLSRHVSWPALYLSTLHHSWPACWRINPEFQHV